MSEQFEFVNLETKASKNKQKDLQQRRQQRGQQRRQRNQRNQNRQSQGQGQGQRDRSRSRGQSQGQRNRSQPQRQQRQVPRRQQQNNRSQSRQQNQRLPLLRRRTGRRQRQQSQEPQKQRQQNVLSLEPQPNVLFKGLGDFITDQKLREICNGYGPLDMCRLDRDAFGNVKPQGIGLVRFDRAEDAKKIVSELNGARIVEGQESQSGGQVAVRFVEPGENWQRYTAPQGVLAVRRRAPFKSNRQRAN